METDTFLFIIYLVVNLVLQLLFSCTKYWPKNHFRAWLFFCATIIFTPIIMFPLQYVIWQVCFGSWGEGINCRDDDAAIYGDYGDS